VIAARELFLHVGFPATTLSAIADRAGVSVQTVYFHFGKKRAVLKEVVDQTVAGDDDDRPLNQREWIQRIVEEPDPVTKIALFAAGISQIVQRTAPIDQMLRSAAAVDPDAAAQRVKSTHQRLVGMREFADNLHDGGRLRPDLTPALAAERVHVLTDGAVRGVASRAAGRVASQRLDTTSMLITRMTRSALSGGGCWAGLP
jgi:AcrR family transcriptional regulator